MCPFLDISAESFSDTHVFQRAHFLFLYVDRMIDLFLSLSALSSAMTNFKYFKVILHQNDCFKGKWTRYVWFSSYHIKCTIHLITHYMILKSVTGKEKRSVFPFKSSYLIKTSLFQSDLISYQWYRTRKHWEQLKESLVVSETLPVISLSHRASFCPQEGIHFFFKALHKHTPLHNKRQKITALVKRQLVEAHPTSNKHCLLLFCW